MTSTESATSAIEPEGSMSTLTGGPTIEFFRGRVATIFGSSGLARSTIRTVSLPGADSTVFPSSSHQTFSSLPTIMNGLAYARLRLAQQSRIAVPKDDTRMRLTGIDVLPMRPASGEPVLQPQITRGTAVLLVRSFAACGPVSGIRATKNPNPAAAIPASNRKAAPYPAATTMKPATPALNAPPRPAVVAIAPWLMLKRPVPRVRSATTSGNSAPKIPAPTPSSNCTDTSQYGLSENG